MYDIRIAIDPFGTSQRSRLRDPVSGWVPLLPCSPPPSSSSTRSWDRVLCPVTAWHPRGPGHCDPHGPGPHYLNASSLCAGSGDAEQDAAPVHSKPKGKSHPRLALSPVSKGFGARIGAALPPGKPIRSSVPQFPCLQAGIFPPLFSRVSAQDKAQAARVLFLSKWTNSNNNSS